MLDILIKAFGFILIIVIGFLLKSKGICKREHGQFLSTIIMNITLPCALLSSINNLKITPVLLIALIIGFMGNVITNIVGYLSSNHESPMNKALSMINTSGYNIGTFTAASTVVSSDQKPTFYSIIKKLFSSIPFCTYIVLFFLSLFHISIPTQVLTITSIAGNANAFLAMLMIGILLEVKLDFSQMKTILKILINRYTISIILSLIVYFLLPLDNIVRKMIVLCLFAPISAVAPVFSTKLGSHSPVPAAVNSLSIMISILILTCLILIFA